MQIDKETFPVNVIEPMDKQILVRSKVADKDKGKMLSLVVLACQKHCKE
jgi:hypothetical protein